MPVQCLWEKAAIAAGTAGMGAAFGIHAPKGVDKIIQNNNIPGYVYDAAGDLGSEFLNGHTNHFINSPVTENDQGEVKK